MLFEEKFINMLDIEIYGKGKLCVFDFKRPG